MIFTKTILNWYHENKRDLPWRRTNDPYIIWISEIILQQTRVEQGMDYFLRFIERFPTLQELAVSEEQEVLKIWQGLGYYTRARNLHAAAKDIAANHNGCFPDRYEKLVKLKGIGQYTAAAIASIAFGQPYPVIDGNVKRFISRYLGIELPVETAAARKKIYDHVLRMMDKRQPGIFNQAIMEFGALQCRPGKPVCSICSLNRSCRALLEGKVEQLPVNRKSKKQRVRYFHYLVIIREGRKQTKYIFLKKREEKDVWKSLFDFPLIEADRELKEHEVLNSDIWQKINSTGKFNLESISPLYKHILSHQVIRTRFYVFRQTGNIKIELPFINVSFNNLANYPVSRLVDQFIRKILIEF